MRGTTNSPLEVNLAGIRMVNPVMTASGTFGYGLEYSDLVKLRRVGAVVVKGTSLQPWPGNPPPRLWETPCGLLNAVGLENVGVEALLRDLLPRLLPHEVPVIVNVVGRSAEEYAEVSARLEDSGVSGIELNVSCPNVKEGCMALGMEAGATYRLVKAVREKVRLPLIVKLTPNASRIADVAVAAEEAGADAVSLINTVLGMAIDVEARKPVFPGLFAGLSGPAVKPIALRMVWEVCSAVSVPVIGMGGIRTANDALEFIMAGASAVAVGTATFANPRAAVEVAEGISRYLETHGISHVTELVGVARPQG